jgi:hypothetical protein
MKNASCHPIRPTSPRTAATAPPNIKEFNGIIRPPSMAGPPRGGPPAPGMTQALRDPHDARNEPGEHPPLSLATITKWVDLQDEIIPAGVVRSGK